MPCASTLPKTSASAERTATSFMLLPPLALPSSGSCGRRKCALSARAPRAPVAIDLTKSAEKRLVVPPRSGEEVPEDPVHLWVQGEPDVAAVHLDRVDVGPEAGLPVHDTVRTRIDRCHRHAGLGAEVPQEAHLDRRAVAVAHHVVE